MKNSHRSKLALSGLLLALVGSGVAAADTIYLKNGRVIRTEKAVVDGGRVMFTQYGHRVAIPLTEVERIVDDEYADPEPLPARPPVTPSGQAGVAPTAPATGTPPPTAPAAVEEPDPEETKEYWQDRVRAIYAQTEAAELELQALRREERAFLFSHRSTAPARRKIEDVQARLAELAQAIPRLRQEARRKGIAPGWLRVRGVNTG